MFQELTSLEKLVHRLVALRSHKWVLFSGAGMSVESGIATFRDSGGLWEQHSIEEVATPEAWQRNPQKVLHFYNLRRRQLLQAQPNAGHFSIAALQKSINFRVITQNIDDLHERAGSREVLHLHGELRKAQSSLDPSLVYPIEGANLEMGMFCKRGSQLRPYVVWFGEAVPMMERALREVAEAKVMVVVGTSLQVYPAAGLVSAAPNDALVLVIDPIAPEILPGSKVYHYPRTAVQGLADLKALLDKSI